MSNVFVLSGSINNKRVKEFHDFLYEASQKEPITLVINSQGGDEHCGRAIAGMISSMRKAGASLNTVGFGDVQSAAVLIFAAGEKRSLSKLASVFVHESSQEGDGNASFFKKTAKQMEVAEKFWCDALASFTGTESKIWEKLHESEVYLSPEEALKLNLATELI